MATAQYRRAVAYLRLSSDDGSGAGLDDQRRLITQAAAQHGLDIDSWHYDDGVSGAKRLRQRPGLRQAVRQLKRGNTLLYAFESRLARDPDVAGEIRLAVRDKGAQLRAAKDDCNGDDRSSRLRLRLEDMLSEDYRLSVGERTKSALAAMKRAGQPWCRVPPYGHAFEDGQVVVSEHEQRGIELARQLRGEGRSLRDIAQVLHRRGFSRGDRAMNHATIGRVLRRAAA